MADYVSLSDMADQTGPIECPKCGCRDFRVDRTRRVTASVKHRWKRCRNCGHQILTSTTESERIVRDIQTRDKDDDGLKLVV